MPIESPWLTAARNSIGQYEDGPDVPKHASEVASAFPDVKGLAQYCALARNETAWCGIFCAAILSRFGIKPPLFEKRDIHVHVPEGATPKDGPSAGVAMVTAIVSVMTGIPVRRDVAMTGEITLRGRVLPIGGLKEKLLAAHRGGIKKVLIPEENAKDLTEISDQIKGGLEIVPVSRMDEVLAQALVRKPERIEWDEAAEAAAAKPVAGKDDDSSSVIAH